MRAYSTLAAVDLGSNSFRLQVARIEDDQIYPLDSLREPVRLASGLTPEKLLDDDTQTRALACLERFGERLRGLPQDAVRAVGTNTFRVAKNAPEFLKRAEAALGFPIDIIAGREEARLIYLGVAHGLPASQEKRLVIDIGGGSTEFIIGTGFKPRHMESLYMGCVSYSRRFFPDGKITKSSLERAELAAQDELQTIAREFFKGKWQQAIGSSGTARALADILQASGFSDSGITAEGLRQLRAALIEAKDCSQLQLPGLRPDRVAVLPGGFAIMAAAFAALKIERMTVAESALREGLLYDLLGRFQHHDMREATVRQFMRRYHVDPAQAGRVAQLAADLFRQLAESLPVDLENTLQSLSWVARLHEIGLSIAHSGYHKHSAYIIQHADMPGFSKKEQTQLALLAMALRGSLAKLTEAVTATEAWGMILALRLAVLFYRSRADLDLPEMQLRWSGTHFQLALDNAWLASNPLTETALEGEIKEWKNIGLRFVLAETPQKLN